MDDTELVIGIDAGGTKTELNALQPDGTTLRLNGPGANVQRASMNSAADVLFSLISKIAERHPGRRIRAVCAGLAGAGRPEDREPLADALRKRFADFEPARGATVLIVHDGVVALESAFPDGSGLVSITGTGSIAYGRTRDGRVERVGGWGYLLGDEGSGHALGLNGVRAVLAAFEGGAPTKLSSLLGERHGINSIADAIRLVYREGWPVASAAMEVIEAAEERDDVALEIVRRQTTLFAEQIGWLGRRLTEEADHQIGLLGGLAQSDFYRDHLREAFTAALPGWTVHRVTRRPVAGALHLASKLGSSTGETSR